MVILLTTCGVLIDLLDTFQLFKQFKAENHGKKIHVYFCGSPALAKVLKTQCDKIRFQFSHSF